MATFISSARAAVKAAVRSAIPTTSVKGMDVIDAERQNWRDLVDRYERGVAGNTLSYPWIVLEFGLMQAGEWGITNDAYDWRVTLWYVDGISNGASTGKTTDALRTGIEDNLNAVKNTLRASTNASFQMQDAGLSIDLTDSNAANQYFIAADVPLFAGALNMVLTIGDPM